MKHQSPGAEEIDRLDVKIARTRAALAKKLGTLRNRVLGHPEPADKKGNRTMAHKKSESATADSKKSAKKSAASKSHARAESKSRGNTKQTATKMVGKTKEVLEDVLAGAAIGAVKGAAGAVLEDLSSSSGKGQRSRKTKKSE